MGKILETGKRPSGRKAGRGEIRLGGIRQKEAP